MSPGLCARCERSRTGTDETRRVDSRGCWANEARRLFVRREVSCAAAGGTLPSPHALVCSKSAVFESVAAIARSTTSENESRELMRTISPHVTWEKRRRTGRTEQSLYSPLNGYNLPDVVSRCAGCCKSYTLYRMVERKSAQSSGTSAHARRRLERHTLTQMKPRRAEPPSGLRSCRRWRCARPQCFHLLLPRQRLGFALGLSLTLVVQ